jgi:hypothetical protein
MEINMGMRIGSAGAAGASQATGIANWQQRQQGIKNLFSALNSGDLKTAQSAYAALGGSSGSGPTSGPLASIGQALANGDLAGAQKAAQQFQAQRSGHHHHQDTQSPATVTASTAPAGSSGSLLNVVA